MNPSVSITLLGILAAYGVLCLLDPPKPPPPAVAVLLVPVHLQEEEDEE
ncbi:hypothetical protein [Deinococcus cellulosilyticus]|uniref:Uncharacterized protein n=1 Tax=Deinococcus cellulosilyticus (strain DSM 18568 / NBRC 106333 / KACC 11606 / 5516J-15) TaxID=1223518 RepID=A0A511MXJ8_DEIC1|nr:hypothetical protein [Deinococcus cellulosilyticus]GEM45314.1 hypothetical protein DC3_09490 [Deinococcus cellulosilyticus NBRC 106333 = KACC 11606]